MNELKEIFEERENRKFTENGDFAYQSTRDKLIDILFMTQYYRNNLSEIPNLGDTEKEKLFSRFIRDPRHGLGERKIGRFLMEKTKVSPEQIEESGRVDDLLYMDDPSYVNYFLYNLKKGEYNFKKWSPRLSSGRKSNKMALKLIDKLKISKKNYRKLIKCKTTESILCSGAVVSDYSQVPSLSFIKNKNNFKTNDADNFNAFLEECKIGQSKIHTGATTPYDIMKTVPTFSYRDSDNEIFEEAGILFNQLKKVPFDGILPILDNSGSMYDGSDSALKAKSVAHYVAKNTNYLNNHILTFSSQPKLLELGDNYRDDCRVLDSFNDMSDTNLADVMKILMEVKEDHPKYLLILSDMEFNSGSSISKDTLMEYYRKNKIKTRIIWWNFNSRNKTCPETDNYGNIFLSGYSPQLLSLLEQKFDAKAFLNKLLEDYRTKITK